MVRGFVGGVAGARSRAAKPRFLVAAGLALGLSGCPQQELAPLLPCTVSNVSINATQSGTDQVDLLFVIDNSGSMSEEQVKLNAQLPRLVQALTSGDLDGMPNADGQQDFRPVGSLRLAVVSSDLGANGVTGVRSCGSNSYLPTEMNMNAMGVDNVDRPFGDDGLLLNSTAVAVSGVTVGGALGGLGAAPTQAIAPRPECALNLPRVLEFPAGGTPAQIATQFSCVAQLGVNGCSVEQQLESMWKALAPSTDLTFSRGTGGQGLPSGLNAGFLRPEAILAIVVVSDEEDCSSPDQSAQAIYSSLDLLQINSQCARNAGALHPVVRYVNGLKSLKAEAFQDRIIFGGIVGVPLASATRGQTLDQILARPDMQVGVGGGLLGQVRPACTARNNAGTATPARRIVEVARDFAENGVITSICEDDYAAALDAVIAKIAGKLSGECLPRSLRRGGDGKVVCRVVEIKAAGDNTACNMARGRTQELPSRLLGGTLRRVCEIAQLPVQGRNMPGGIGWYYDDFSNEVMRCASNPQRIAFTPTAGIDNGASARFECFQSVASNAPLDNARGLAAVNAPCAPGTVPAGPRGMAGASGDGRCRALSTQDARLICVSGFCQLSCMTDVDCPIANVCTANDGTGYCTNPTCPQ
jgi:hypothetical protein